ncbi:MAG: hypothetical protein AAGG57_14460 [Pseudomonadota bacterium]
MAHWLAFGIYAIRSDWSGRNVFLGFLLFVASGLDARADDVNCPALPSFAQLVRTEGASFGLNDLPSRTALRTLRNRLEQTDIRSLKYQLDAVGHGHQFAATTAFITEIATFSSAGLRFGPEAARAVASRPSFQGMLRKTRHLLLQVCSAPNADRSKEVDAEETEPNAIDRTYRRIRDATFGSNRPGLRVASVFGVWMMALCLLTALQLLAVMARAYIQHRYACRIPAVVDIGAWRLQGHVSLISVKGFRFQPSDNTLNEVKMLGHRGLICEISFGKDKLTSRTHKISGGQVTAFFDERKPRTLIADLLNRSTLSVRRTIWQGQRIGPVTWVSEDLARDHL